MSKMQTRKRSGEQRLYPFTRSLIEMQKRDSVWFIDDFFIGLGIVLETLALPIYPFVYRLYKWMYRESKKGDGVNER